MDFSEALTTLAGQAQKYKESLKTEAATKAALIGPFIQAMGYNLSDPLEVIPEFIADIPSKKGWKVDYAIMQDGKPIMIIECKTCGTPLDIIGKDQLKGYFLTLDSSIGILTDGIVYRFFSTAEDGKNMDETPFMEFNLEAIDPTLLPELRKLCKGKFDLQRTLDTVSELKFNRQVKLALLSNLDAPDMDFIDYLLGRAGIKGLRQKTKEERYARYVKRALTEFVDEQVDTRLKTALAATSKKDDPPEQSTVTATVTDILTENEWQACYLVKSILAGIVDADRIFLRNLSGVGKSVIVMDGSIHKPLVRLLFNNQDRLSIEIITESKDRIPFQIKKIEDILPHTETIRTTARMYLTLKKTNKRVTALRAISPRIQPRNTKTPQMRGFSLTA